jgi:hypothetical protein
MKNCSKLFYNCKSNQHIFEERFFFRMEHVSDITCKQGRNAKEWVKKPTYPKFGMQNAPVVKRQANLDGRDQCARINDAHWILDPPRLSTFKRRGGGGCTPESRGALLQWLQSESPDQRCIGNLDLPRLSSFNQRGSFPRRVTSRATTPLQPIFHFTS